MAEGNLAKGSSKLRVALWIIGGLLVLGAALTVVAALFIHAFVNELKDQTPATAAEIAQAANALKHPGTEGELSTSRSKGMIGSLADKTKEKMVREAVLKGLEGLRENVGSAGSDDEMAKRLAEISKSIQSFKVDDNTRKMVSKEILNAAIKTYLKEASKEERAIFDPLVLQALDKLTEEAKR